MGLSTAIAGVGAAAAVGSTVASLTGGGDDTSGTKSSATSTAADAYNYGNYQNLVDYYASVSKDASIANQKNMFSYLENLSETTYAAAMQYWNDTLNSQIEYNMPWYTSGKEANELYSGILTGDTDPTETLRSTPGYEWTYKEGVNALDKSAASKGKLFSGGQSKALISYGQGLADTTYNKYMDRLSSLSKQGQTAAESMSGYYGDWAKGVTNAGQNRMSTMTSVGENTANQISNAYTNYGNTNAAAATSAMNAATGKGGSTTTSTASESEDDSSSAWNNLSELGGMLAAYGLKKDPSSYEKEADEKEWD
ncbi:MAG: hypothetical protein V1843_02695 [bacterium]